MGEKIHYQRSFLMFRQEDSGYGAGQEPSGYVKIEVKDGSGKAQVLVQNLRDDGGKYKYKAYFIKSDYDSINPVLMGYIPLDRGKGELGWSFNPENVGETGLPVDGFNMVAVILDNNGQSRVLTCPLAAYKNKKVDWRQRVTELFSREVPEPRKDEEEVHVNPAIDRMTQAAQAAVVESIDSDNAVSPAPVLSDNTAEVRISEAEENIMQYEETAQNDKLEEERPDEKQQEGVFNQESADAGLNRGDSEALETGKVYSAYDRYRELLERHNELARSDSNAEAGKSCIYKNKAYCTSMVNASGYNPCAQCHMNNSEKSRGTKSTGHQDVEKLKEYLGSNFEPYNPFNSKRKDYKWWKINNPVFLNNFLYQCNISTPILFNPRILMSHFKYRHLIFGVFQDAARRREYVVFGVPGVYNVDDRPFGDMCRWVQIEGNRPKYGAFGYWLIYLEPKTGKILDFA